MSSNHTKVWSKYDFKANNKDKTSYPLNNIAHIVHVKDSFPIIDRGYIPKRRIYDESKLTCTTASVVWLSPFDWPYSIYGNVCFQIDWKDLVKSRSIYWVEDIAYARPAVRFLLTKRALVDIPFSAKLQHYDPAKDNGPLKVLNGDWFYNAETSVEVMLDEDIKLNKCVKLELIEHNPDICRTYKSACKDKRRKMTDLRSQFLAFLVGTQNQSLCKAMTTDIGLPNGSRYHKDLMYPFLALSGALIRNQTFSGRELDKDDVDNVVIAACLLLSHDHEIRAAELISTLQSEEVAESSLERIVQEQFDLKGVKLHF